MKVVFMPRVGGTRSRRAIFCDGPTLTDGPDLLHYLREAQIAPTTAKPRGRTNPAKRDRTTARSAARVCLLLS
jgi:hypothetical protein